MNKQNALIQTFLHSGTVVSQGDNRLLIGYGKREWLEFPSDQKDCFFFPDFFLNASKQWFTHEYIVTVTIEELLSLLPQENFNLTMQWKNPHKTFFFDSFEKLQKAFQLGVLTKAVPYIFEYASHRMTPRQLQTFLKNALFYAKEHNTFIYGFWDEEEGMLGVTPELLFKYKKTIELDLETVACAGTYPIGQGSRKQSQELIKEQLLNDPKEKKEHQWVIDGICSSLSELGTVSIGNSDVLALPNLLHLLTPIKATLPVTTTFMTIVKALHPTPALGAIPRFEGMKWLLDYQRAIDRRRYGAPSGYIRKEGSEGNCFVSIRNIQWDKRGMAIGAGCGVIAAGIVEKEWMELQAKLKAIHSIFAVI